ncbi:MAG TPA: hypothetical protein VFO18_11085 [Methylomirabilota bacterium]|nr:hypothetical protein [Methylomirabilota bacterium]
MSGAGAGPEWVQSPEVATVAEALWLRVRDVVLAERRLERFAFDPEPAAGSLRRGLDAVAGDAEALSGLARDVALRAVAAAADPVNFRILSSLGAPDGLALGELSGRVGLPPLALAERLGALAQAGLAGRDLERERAFATPAGRGLSGMVDALAARLNARMKEELPALLDG